MALSPGTRLGPYEILSALGAGGMGEVYKARDGRLDRTVAIKILPDALAADAQFRDRFDREARAVSQLDHPHICALYDIGEDHGTAFLVMQFLEGETLENALKRGALPLDHALKTAMEIASALDAAHRAGIVHRDLKPGNIILTKGGAKLLDFGLAKTLPGMASANLSMLQTTPAAVTAQGTILGTFQYMSPEQIEGEEVDARSDVFAFGAVLYEMLTGRKAFAGKSQASMLGAILKDEPPPVSHGQPMTPPALDYLVRTCLAKDPDARFQTAHDVWLQLRWIAEGGSAVGVPAPIASKRRSRERLAWAAAAVLGAIALGAGALAVVHLRERAAPADPVQFTIAAEENSTLVTPAEFSISPDGRQVVFLAASSGASSSQGRPMLWVRPFATLAARALPGTEGAIWASTFWSPDGRYIGFAAAGKLKKVDVSGGPPTTLCDFSGLFGGGTWNRKNVIVFGTSIAPLQKVDAAGGTPTPVTTDKSENPLWPSFLPDDEHLLYVARPGSVRELRIASLAAPETIAVGATESQGLYSSGHLLFVRGGTVMALPFDAAALRTTGDPFPVAEQIPVNATAIHAALSASSSGVLGYWRGGGLSMARLTWTDRTGKSIGLVGEPGAYTNLSLSSDERRVAVALSAGSPVNRDIWIIDLARADTATRLTFDAAQEGDPIWSPDGSKVVFNSNRSGLWNSGFQRSADGGGDDVPLATMGRLFDSPDWSHDGRFIVFTGAGRDESNDLWILPLSGERKPERFLQTSFSEDSPAFSPDDRWVAYNSDASGRFEVYVRSFPGPGGQFQISRNGGWAPKWRGDGKEIFFLALDGTMMAADITPGKELQAGVPHALFPTQLLKGSDRHSYAVTKDGKRFLLRVPDQRQVTVPITIVLNWPATAKK
jgi:Tol biopolymer transport system component/predicted Ser/Thr protein kinase